jgi:hypothetical protein
MNRLMSAGVQLMMFSRSSSACSRFMEPSMACACSKTRATAALNENLHGCAVCLPFVAPAVLGLPCKAPAVMDGT